MSDQSHDPKKPEETPAIPLDELLAIRHKKIADLRQSGINPYPYRFVRSHQVSEVIERFDTLSSSETVVSLAGRIMLKRKMGKSIFADIHDFSGRIQVYFKIDVVGETAFNLFDLLDLGDVVGVTGVPFITRTGEKTIRVQNFELLAKAIQPLPDKHAGLVDKETRYRRRYVDLIVNPEVRETLVKRSRIIKSIRQFLDSRGFLEVETPILQPLYGGASARPFVTHHNTLDMTLYLRIADELYLKRLIVGGFEKVWEFCKDFRNEGMDRLHNPEFSMVELYWAYADYKDIMQLFQDLLRQTVLDLHGKYKIPYEEYEIDFEPPFKEISMIDAIKEKTGIDLLPLEYDAAKALAKEKGIDADDLKNWGKVVEAFFEHFVEPTLIQPTIIKDFPREISPLAKVHRDNPRLTERFELFIGTLETGNAFSELNDPEDQRQRFLDQVAQRQAGDEEAQQYDEDYVTALSYGMPPTGGLGFGIDRLVMLLTNCHSIRDVIFFPQMRPE
ncbi:lysine tRNA synthetase, inducible [Candidatus Zixiibacteriota bacterium]|nr:lysine tRNA synthetase, inducible [candidate division Zixibacteria bacterium]